MGKLLLSISIFVLVTAMSSISTKNPSYVFFELKFIDLSDFFAIQVIVL